jgi:DNA modification methylase
MKGCGIYSMGGNADGKNPGDVWEIPTTPFPGAHFAVMPVELARRCIAAGCKPGGIVLDPFSGSGTTGLAANQLGHRYVGIDLNADYLADSLRTRFRQGSLIVGDSA